MMEISGDGSSIGIGRGTSRCTPLGGCCSHSCRRFQDRLLGGDPIQGNLFLGNPLLGSRLFCGNSLRGIFFRGNSLRGS